ncbi:hypothetical protein PAMP_012165 [Pampus punctatissimus]
MFSGLRKQEPLTTPPPPGSEARWETGSVDCAEPQSLAGPVSHDCVDDLAVIPLYSLSPGAAAGLHMYDSHDLNSFPPSLWLKLSLSVAGQYPRLISDDRPQSEP